MAAPYSSVASSFFFFLLLRLTHHLFFPLSSPTAKPQDETPPQSLNERTARVYAQGHPYAATLASSGPSGLTPAERTAWANAHVARSPTTLLKRLGTKPQREVWKAVNEASLPLRALPPSSSSTTASWGRDRFGADLGDYPPEQFAARAERTLLLAALEVQHWAFLEKRDRERAKRRLDSVKTAEEVVVTTPEEIEEETLRRKEIASLRMELYGQRSGAYSTDPAWDDVIPMPVEDSDGALAAIAYPEEYAEGMLLLTYCISQKLAC